MSIAAFSIGEAPIAAADSSNSKTNGPPPKRTLVATSDAVAQPEPR